MIFTENPKKIRVMFTPFRDGLQSSFGGKVRIEDFLPALEASVDAGIRHFEFGGGARYQAPFFYLRENPFETMKKFRDVCGPDVDLQILTRSVSGVTLTTQSIEGLQLQAKLMKEYGTTWDRNFDYMNDVRNLVNTGRPIVEAGMHHQVCIALMGLPFHSDKVHTADFYINIGKKLLESDIHIDSICLKDASGTTDPKTIYDTVKGLKKILPPEIILWQHTHDTASMAVACYMAGIEAGVDGIDLSVRPMASGTVQPDVRSVDHALKGTGYSLDIDAGKMNEIENLLNEGMKDYNFNPTTTTADARVVGFPMPGGAIGPNVHMMVKAGILDKYNDVLAEFPVVVKAGGAWTSVTPGSQQYWLQAFNNVLYGRWKKIDAGFGRAVLGYFGKTPLPSDPKVIEIASEQLDLKPFEGNPLEAAPKNIGKAQEALKNEDLPVNDVNTFLVLSAMVPGKKIEANEGMRFLKGKGKLDIPIKKKADTKEEAERRPAAVKPTGGNGAQTPVKSKVKVEESGRIRNFVVTVEPVEQHEKKPVPAAEAEPPSKNGQQVYSTFAGQVEITDIKVNKGDKVSKGKVIATIEAMKAEHEIKAPCDGTVGEIHVEIGDEIDSTKPILTIQD
jgi:pyruvate carboxylase subunit B